MLKRLKRTSLAIFEKAGLFALVRDSPWRARRLLILCYHGVSRSDEHLWRPALFMEPNLFADRMRLLAESGYNVLPLDEGISRLYSGSLPERSVVLTFDDGEVGFHAHAHPILREHGFPATVYLTTYYCDRQLPVFNLICSYLLWKSRGNEYSTADVIGEPLMLDTRTERSRSTAVVFLCDFAERAGLSGVEKNELASRLAAAVDIDYGKVLEDRLLHLMNPDEVAELRDAGVDFQLHTHRHRSPEDESLYKREIQENRSAIRSMTGLSASHFCYPSGVVRPEFSEWLAEEGVVSATTCEIGLANSTLGRLTLPRMVDVSALSEIEFRGWLTGVSQWLPGQRSPD